MGEERLKSLRTLFDAKDEHIRWLSDRVERAGVDGRLKEVFAHISELKEQRQEYREQFNSFDQKLSRHEQLHDLTQQHLARVPSMAAEDDVDRESNLALISGSAIAIEIKEC